MENIKDKAKDDQDFLYNYGSIRTPVSSEKYRENYERIFRKPTTDRHEPSVDVFVSNES